MEDLIGTIATFSIVFFSAAAFIYVTSLKIGNSVGVSLSIGMRSNSSVQTFEIVLQNHKDKPVVINRICAVFNNEILLQLKEFSPPSVLRPLDCLSFKADEYSYLTVNGCEFEPDFTHCRIFLETTKGIIRCSWSGSLDEKIRFSELYEAVDRHKESFNDFIYGSDVKYILVYERRGETRTAFIFNNGSVGNQWDFDARLFANNSNRNHIKEVMERMVANSSIDCFGLFRPNRGSGAKKI